MRVRGPLSLLWGLQAVLSGVSHQRIWQKWDFGVMPWVGVNNRAELEAGLKCSSCLLSFSVDNGTEWLHLGGDLHTFMPIVTSPGQSSPTSDLSLTTALQLVKETGNNNIGVFISFVTPSIIPESLSSISSLFPQPNLSFPLLVSLVLMGSSSSPSPVSLVPSDSLTSLQDLVPGAIPTLGWDTRHGLDPVWERMEREAILKTFQINRIRRVIAHLYRSPEDIPADDVRFVELLKQRLELSSPTSFSSLVTEQLYSAIDTNGHHKLEKGPWAPKYTRRRPPRRKSVRALLQEYYLNTTTYTESDISRMKEIAGKIKHGQPLALTVRAGLAASQEGSEAVAGLMRGMNNSVVVVTKKDTDREQASDIRLLTTAIGRERVISGLPGRLIDTKEEGRIPEPRNSLNYNSGSEGNQGPAVFAISLALCTFIL